MQIPGCKGVQNRKALKDSEVNQGAGKGDLFRGAEKGVQRGVEYFFYTVIFLYVL